MKYKQFISGLVIGTIVAGSGLAFADSNISAVLSNSIHFKFNGQEQDPSDGVLVYNGHTYVPTRFIADQLGAIVDWDGKTQTVNITSGGATANSAAPTNNATSDSSTVTSGATPNEGVTGKGVIGYMGDSSGQLYTTDITITSGPMQMHISSIDLDPAYKVNPFDTTTEKAIVLTVSTENMSSSPVQWFPETGTLLLNTQEKCETGYSTDVGGLYNGHVQKTGTIVFAVNSNLSDIKGFTYQITAPTNSNLASVGNDIAADIKLS